jgi:hypothetical protein
MDRLTVEYGQLPLETDLLYAQRFAMVGLAKMAETVLGTGTIVDGFDLHPTSPSATMSLVMSPGCVYELENLEQTTWSSLGTDNHNIVKQGVLLDAVTMTFTAPTTVGYAQNYLVQVQYQDLDTGAVVRPYFDSANPALPFEGPGNAGTADNTVRKGYVSYNVKAGSPAPAGTQAVPTPDAGYAGLWVVTVANGATTVSSGNIVMYDFAPFLPVKLPRVPAGVQNGTWVGADDTGIVNGMAAKIWPPPSSLVKYMAVMVKAAFDNTGATTFNLNNLGAVAVVNKDGSALQAGQIKAGGIIKLVFDGTRWQRFSGDPPPAAVTIDDRAMWHYGVADGTGSTISTVAVPTPVALVSGLELCLKCTSNNTGPVTINVNGLGQRPIVLNEGGGPLQPGHMITGRDYYMVFEADINSWRLMTPSALPVAAAPVVSYGLGTAVGQQILQMIACPNNSTPETMGFAIGMTTSASSLAAGTVGVGSTQGGIVTVGGGGGLPVAVGKVTAAEFAINNTAVPAQNGFGVSGGVWCNWPGLAGTWRLDAWTEMFSWNWWGYYFFMVWTRIA